MIKNVSPWRDPAYKILNTKPTSKIEKIVSAAIKTCNLEPSLQKQLLSHDSRVPRMYGLPKIHKPSVPLRPIVSAIGSPTYKLAKYLTPVLGKLVGKSECYIKNSVHFVERIRSLKLDPSNLLVSFDVVSLFTNVPVDDTMQIVKDLLKDDVTSEHIVKLTEVCLKSTHFQFRDKFYEQQSGAAMGSPLSPVIANIFMETFEQHILESFVLKPKCWYRYVDDTFVIWPHGKDSLNQFLDHLNSQHSTIKFTMEIEQSGCLPFLDVLIKRNADGTLAHSVYRKPTHTKGYLNAASHHHPSQKNSVVNSLVHRAFLLSDKESLENELKVVSGALLSNGYKNKDVQKCINKYRNPMPSVRKEPIEAIGTVFLPFVKGSTDKISRLFRKYNVKTVFSPAQKISDILPSTKDSLPLHVEGVYKTPCSCGKVYIGETKRTISTRLKEHERHCRLGHVSQSALAEHRLSTGHSIEFDRLTRESSFYPRKYHEAIEVWKHPNNLNPDDGFLLHSAWKSPLVRQELLSQP